MEDKLMKVEEAIKLIKSGKTLAISGDVSVLAPEKVLSALEKRFIETKKPTDLTIVFPVIVGYLPEKGLEHLAHKGMLKKVIGSSFNQWGAEKLNTLIRNNAVEAYNLPMGVMYQLIRATACQSPGIITSVGMGSYLDPRKEGPGFNEISKDEFCKIIDFEDKKFLLYKAVPIDIAIIVGSTADGYGNITTELEPLRLAIRYMAIAAKASGGKVIAEVRRVAKKDSLHPKMVEVPGIFVDAVVINDNLPVYDPASTGEIRASIKKEDFLKPLDIKKIIARRALLQIKNDNVVNLGVGMPTGIPSAVVEEDMVSSIIFSIEHGGLGGIPIDVPFFGTAINPQAILDTETVHHFYQGGLLDATCLGMAQVDRQGNVNVTRFGNRAPGCGGFLDIVDKTKKIVFCGAFTARGLDIEIEKGKLRIKKEGRIKKFVTEVNQVTFNAPRALSNNQKVFYITERAVFELEKDGLTLIEVAPGIDLQTHILSQMEFKPHISPNLREIPKEIFR